MMVKIRAESIHAENREWAGWGEQIGHKQKSVADKWQCELPNGRLTHRTRVTRVSRNHAAVSAHAIYIASCSFYVSTERKSSHGGCCS